ncbi:MAG: hypothetical protein WCK05_05930 [Planctomycetota bacterium]
MDGHRSGRRPARRILPDAAHRPAWWTPSTAQARTDAADPVARWWILPTPPTRPGRLDGLDALAALDAQRATCCTFCNNSPPTPGPPGGRPGRPRRRWRILAAFPPCRTRAK